MNSDSLTSQHAAPATGASAVRAHAPWRAFLREQIKVGIFNTLIAVALTVVHFGGSFWGNLLFSQCIGLSISLAIDGGRRVLWPDGNPPVSRILVLTVFGCVGGMFFGGALATALLGLPFAMWLPRGGESLSVVLLIALLGTGVGTYHGWSRARLAQLRELAAEQALRETAAEKQLVRAQLQTLQAQLEPHFLFNVLANLDSLIATDPARARVLLAHLNRFLRSSLTATRTETLTLAAEFDLLEALLAIQQVRFGARLRYTLDLPADCREMRVPPMLLQPLVENALKHGIEPLPAGGSIVVSAARVTPAQLILRVTDDGAGFPGAHHGGASGTDMTGTPGGQGADANEARVADVRAMPNGGTASSHPGEGHGIGLANVRERLRVLYGDAARLTLTERTPHGVIAELRLPHDGH